MESAGFEEGAADGEAWAAGSCLRGRRCFGGGTGPKNSGGASTRRCRDSGGGGFLRSGSTPANRRRRRRHTYQWSGAGWWRHAGEEAIGVRFYGRGHKGPSRARLGHREAAPAGCPWTPASPGPARGGRRRQTGLRGGLVAGLVRVWVGLEQELGRAGLFASWAIRSWGGRARKGEELRGVHQTSEAAAYSELGRLLGRK
jgi:hypothetical protein